MPYHVCGCVVNSCTGKQKWYIKSALELEKLNNPFSCMQVIIFMRGLVSSQNLDPDNVRSYSKMKLNSSSCWTSWQKSPRWWTEQDQTKWGWLAGCEISRPIHTSIGIFFLCERILMLCWVAKAAILLWLEVVSGERKTLLAATSFALSILSVYSLENSLIFKAVAAIG